MNKKQFNEHLKEYEYLRRILNDALFDYNMNEGFLIESTHSLKRSTYKIGDFISFKPNQEADVHLKKMSNTNSLLNKILEQQAEQVKNIEKYKKSLDEKSEQLESELDIDFLREQYPQCDIKEGPFPLYSSPFSVCLRSDDRGQFVDSKLQLAYCMFRDENYIEFLKESDYQRIVEFCLEDHECVTDDGKLILYPDKEDLIGYPPKEYNTYYQLYNDIYRERFISAFDYIDIGVIKEAVTEESFYKLINLDTEIKETVDHVLSENGMEL
ncbi:hypothetical protein [Breznakia pachnodae]|uniref:Uncharacterized protein n=1 Tax=Breznakia pachnodae TaxID=265178 RepID=A0ABU0E4D6_9FIRM|nr:hypothetical protein [Breznakia pachnodae]MDQ0361581.1 hypothetical protein [Breznakia pachnodae]